MYPETGLMSKILDNILQNRYRKPGIISKFRLFFSKNDSSLVSFDNIRMWCGYYYFYTISFSQVKKDYEN